MGGYRKSRNPMNENNIFLHIRLSAQKRVVISECVK